MSMRPETFRSDERTTLVGFLRAQRDIVRAKTEGFDAADLARSHAPSGMTLGGMVRHLTFVEHEWSVCVWAGLPREEPWVSAARSGVPDWDWRWSADEDPRQLRADWEAACRRTDEIVLASSGLDEETAQQPYLPYEGPDARITRRFVLVHLIEEVARHAGHADVIAESIDGRTGQ